jgi:hypothetical protein
MGKIVTQQTTGRGRSWTMWKGLDRDIQLDNNKGIYSFNNTINFMPAAWEVGASDTNPASSNTYEGSIVLTTGATDNHQSFLMMGGSDSGYLASVNATERKGYSWMVECRVLFTSIADQGFMFGMADPSIGAVDPLVNNTGAVADKDFIGFRVLTPDSDGIDAVFYKEGGSEVIEKEEAQVITANDWYKLGIRYTPQAPLSKDRKIEYFVDGASVGFLTQSDLELSTFPDGSNLVPVMAIKTGEGVTKSVHCSMFDFAWLFDSAADP